MTETCETCRFWKAEAEDAGICRRYPPSPNDVAEVVSCAALDVIEQLKGVKGLDRIRKLNFATAIDALERQPKTTIDDWCGEYQQLTAPAPAAPLPPAEVGSPPASPRQAARP